MKTKISAAMLVSSLILSAGFLQAQTTYSFPISTILNSMPAGVRLPNGTIVRAARVVTGPGTHSAVSGTSNPDAMGGTFTGTSFLPFYVGSTVRQLFTIIETNSTTNVDNGIGTNCNKSIGFRIYFDRPTVKISFLALDIDGANTNPGNAEWVSSFAFNGSTYIPYSQLTDGSNGISGVAINTSLSTHNWRTLITGTTGAAAAANLPASMSVQRASGGSIPPDNLGGQVVFTPSDPDAAVTDFFLLWGVWQVPSGNNVQTSGLSPIVVRVSPDFGDLPDSYKTLLASGGPSHGVVGTLFFGAADNTEGDGLPTALADASTDDDGIATVPIVPNSGSLSQVIPTYSLTTAFTNNVGVAANYVAWIDWNNNGSFETTEAQTATTGAATTNGTVTFTWNNVLLSGLTGRANTFARIRVTTEAITSADVGGAFKDGEVEDYLVPFAIPLPVRLTFFSGKTDNGHVLLSWKTETEVGADRFEIERSVDGRSFTVVGQVPATGNTVSTTTYHYNDLSPAISGINTYYYRLNQFDNDGRQAYSSTIAIGMLKNDAFKASIIPNPAGAILNLVLEGVQERETLLFEVFTTNGMLVYKEQIATGGGSMIKSLRRPAINAGIYFYKITRSANGGTVIGKLLLQ